MSHGFERKPGITKYLPRVIPPPFSGIAVAVDYANIALDPDIPLYERYCAVSTAVRLLATLRREHLVVSVYRLLKDSGLCKRFRDIDIDICENIKREDDYSVIEKFVEIINTCENGDIPVTEELVLALAQAIIVTLVPQLKTLVSSQMPEEI